MEHPARLYGGGYGRSAVNQLVTAQAGRKGEENPPHSLPPVVAESAQASSARSLRSGEMEYLPPDTCQLTPNNDLLRRCAVAISPLHMALYGPCYLMRGQRREKSPIRCGNVGRFARLRTLAPCSHDSRSDSGEVEFSLKAQRCGIGCKKTGEVEHG